MEIHIFSSSLKLNPAELKEQDGLLANYDGSNVPSFLGPLQGLGLIFETNPASCGGMCPVDWNRDGTFSPSSTTVRAGPTLSPHCIDASQHNDQELETIHVPQPTSPTFQGSPVLVRNDDYFYIFYLNSSGEIRHRVAQVRLDGLYGSCNTDMDVLKTAAYEQILGQSIACLDWHNGPTFETNVTSINAISYHQNKILLIYTKTDGGGNRVLYSRIYHGFNQSASGIPPSDWSSPISRPLGTFLFPGLSTISIPTTPSFSRLYVNPTNFSGQNTVIGLFYVDRSTDPGENKWYWFNQSTETWSASSSHLLDTNGDKLLGYVPPAFVMWPGGTGTAEDRTCGLVPDVDNAGDFYCFLYLSERWKKLTSVIFPGSDGRPTGLLSQPEIVFHRQRKTDGSPVSNDDTQGQFWLAYQSSKNSAKPRYIIYRSDTISGASWPFDTNFSSSNTMFARQRWSATMDGTLGKRMSMFEDLKIAGVKAALIQLKGSANDHVITFLPFVDDTFRTLDTHLATGNDFRVMERGICWGLHSRNYYWIWGPFDAGQADNYCGAIGDSFWNY